MGLGVAAIKSRTAILHGRSVAWTESGEGPVLLLIHGMGGSSDNWREVIEPLARHRRVVAPDLPGHGDSQAGSGDYSVGALAAGLRDLLLLLGHERITPVGHSLGGGIAMQFAYLFPELTERLILVSSGGLGPEVSSLLRAAALPGAGPFIAATSRVARRLPPFPSRLGRSIDLREVVAGYASLADRERRAAFLSTVRAVIGLRGQRFGAGERLYLAAALPVLILWGGRDRLVPVQHAAQAHRAIPGSLLEVFEEAGHLPQLEVPRRFVERVDQFLAETEAAPFDRDDWRARFVSGAPLPAPG